MLGLSAQRSEFALLANDLRLERDARAQQRAHVALGEALPVEAHALIAGLAGERSGLWFEQRRIIEELCPPAVAVENVTSGEKLWLPRVQHDLLSLGYRVEAWRLGAVDVGAPHRRARTFVLGVHPDECRAALGNADPQGQRQKTSHRQERRRVEDASPLADAERQQLREQPGGGRGPCGPEAAEPAGSGQEKTGLLSARWVECLMGFPPDWTATDGRPVSIT